LARWKKASWCWRCRGMGDDTFGPRTGRRAAAPPLPRAERRHQLLLGLIHAGAHASARRPSVSAAAEAARNLVDVDLAVARLAPQRDLGQRRIAGVDFAL